MPQGHQQFVDTVKMLPEYDESICDESYDDLKCEVNESGELMSQLCQKTHLMSKKGLVENKSVQKMLKSTKMRKLLSEQSETLT